MRQTGKCVVFVVMAVALAGCATKRYGRLQPLTSYETLRYTCDQIDMELSKVDAFDRQVAQQAKFSGMSVASFLGDFGIGNVIERNQAVKTAAERRAQLQEARVVRHCGEPGSDLASVQRGGPQAAPAAGTSAEAATPKAAAPSAPGSGWWDKNKPQARADQ